MAMSTKAQGSSSIEPARERSSVSEKIEVIDKVPFSDAGGSDVDREGGDVVDSGGAFDQTGLGEFYAPIDGYEGQHRYDPHARWTSDEENRLIRRIDIRICLWCCLMFFALNLDRGNITQALSDNLLNDLNMTTNDFNTGQTIFYFSFVAAELPSQLISKKIGPDNWIPIQMIMWSVVAICQCKLTGRTSFFVTRSLLGLIEGGFIPDVVLYLSYWYKGKELPVRLSYFWAAYCLTFIVSAFLAYGLLQLRGVGGWAGWQWLFALEGAATCLIGIASWFYLPPSPTQTASFFRGSKGWFSEREEVILVNRVLRDDPSKGDMHNRQAVTPKLLWEALKDYDMWPLYVLGVTWLVPAMPAQNYLTLTLKDLGFGTLQTNLLTVPAYTLLMLQTLITARVSEHIQNRYAVVLYSQIYCLPLLVALEVLPGGSLYRWPRYVLTTMLAGFPYTHPITVALTSRNAGTVRTRTVGSALYNICVQASSIISANVYRTQDQPYYRYGNKVLLGLCAWNITVIVFSKIYYVRKNAQRERIWDNMSQESRIEYLQNTTDSGNKRLDFSFAH